MTVTQARNAGVWLARERGFTLIELVVSIAIAAVIVGFVGMFMSTPMDAYFAQTRRTDLSDSADAITRAFEQDVRTALPNSIRITRNGSVVAVEMLATAGSARYWEAGETAVSPGGAARELDFSGAPDAQFSTDGTFNAAVHALAPTTFHLSVNNLGTPGANAYELANVMTPAGTSIALISSGGEDQVTLTPGFHFIAASASHTIFAVTQPVAYLCDEGLHTVTRYAGYSIAADPTTRDSAGALNGAGAVSYLVAQFPTACQFDLSAGTAHHGGVLSLRVTLVKDGETMQLFHQVPVEGVP